MVCGFFGPQKLVLWQVWRGASSAVPRFFLHTWYERRIVDWPGKTNAPTLFEACKKIRVALVIIAWLLTWLRLVQLQNFSSLTFGNADIFSFRVPGKHACESWAITITWFGDYFTIPNPQSRGQRALLCQENGAASALSLCQSDFFFGVQNWKMFS